VLSLGCGAFIRFWMGTGSRGEGMGGESSKIRPKTKVVELVEHYKSRLGQFLDPGLRWLAKHKILSETRVFSAKNSEYLVNRWTDCLETEFKRKGW